MVSVLFFFWLTCRHKHTGVFGCTSCTTVQVLFKEVEITLEVTELAPDLFS